MLELFIEGGSLFMGVLSLLLLAVLSLAVINGTQILSGKVTNHETMQQRIAYIKSVGLFSLVFGVLGQLLGLFQAFGSLAQIGKVEAGIMASGMRVSMITTIFGIIIFLISYLLWFALEHKLNNKSN